MITETKLFKLGLDILLLELLLFHGMRIVGSSNKLPFQMNRAGGILIFGAWPKLSRFCGAGVESSDTLQRIVRCLLTPQVVIIVTRAVYRFRTLHNQSENVKNT